MTAGGKRYLLPGMGAHGLKPPVEPLPGRAGTAGLRLGKVGNERRGGSGSGSGSSGACGKRGGDFRNWCCLCGRSDRSSDRSWGSKGNRDGGVSYREPVCGGAGSIGCSERSAFRDGEVCEESAGGECGRIPLTGASGLRMQGSGLGKVLALGLGKDFLEA